jgi:hypothetical protein
MSVVYPDSNTDRMQSKSLHIESVEIFTPYTGETGMLLHIQCIWEVDNGNIEIILFDKQLGC